MTSWDYHFNLVNQSLACVNRPSLDQFVELLCDAAQARRMVFLAGNGGSAATASHFAQDISRAAFEGAGAQLRVACLSDNTSLLSALANDIGYEFVFERQLSQFASSGDLFVAISGSGKSPNILRAASYAIEQGLKVVGLTGFDGGMLSQLAQCSINIPVGHMGVTEAGHGAILHAVAERVQQRLHAERSATRASVVLRTDGAAKPYLGRDDESVTLPTARELSNGTEPR